MRRPGPKPQAARPGPGRSAYERLFAYCALTGAGSTGCGHSDG